MYPTKNDLPEGARSKVVDLLNARLAEVSRGVDKWLWMVEAHSTAER